MDLTLPAQILQVSGAAALGLVGIAFGIQKLLKGWKETSTESSILGIMHNEFERMSEQNTTLSNELNRLQIELVNLNKELYKLTVENQNLHAEVATLTNEIVTLKKKLDTKVVANDPTSQD